MSYGGTYRISYSYCGVKDIHECISEQGESRKNNPVALFFASDLFCLYSVMLYSAFSKTHIFIDVHTAWLWDRIFPSKNTYPRRHSESHAILLFVRKVPLLSFNGYSTFQMTQLIVSTSSTSGAYLFVIPCSCIKCATSARQQKRTNAEQKIEETRDQK